MTKLHQRMNQFTLLSACLLFSFSSAAAQSTVFNIPSSDVQAPRKVYLEADFITHFASYKDGGYQTYGEQPLTKKFSFVSDWSSGNNDFGYLVVGTGITLSPKSLLYAGYNFGNQGRGNNSLGVFYGYSF